jgi:AcrR family transcriptional regulator
MPAVELLKAIPSRDDSDPTRAKLISAAGEVFAEMGFQAATVREICQRAGANVAAVNYHFRDKLGLYTEVLRESISANQGEVMQQAITEAKNPEEALRMLISGMLSRIYREDRPAWSFRLMGHEMAQPTPALNRVIDEVLRPRYEQLRGILAQILQLPADHATTRLCAHSVIGQVIHYVHARPFIGMLWPDLNLIDAKDRQMVSNHIADFTLRNLHALSSTASHSKRKEKSK